jgi:MFS family permease
MRLPSGLTVTTTTGITRTYYGLVLGNTLAASLIWGINTLFLLDAGLSNLQAFAANAFFTAGMVLFEVPTGVVADMWGRRASFLLGTLTLSASTALYVGLWAMDAPFWQWALVSVLLGLGFTFFSGATEAWLVDALTATGYRGTMETVFGRAQVITGVATLAGSAGGGFLAQATNLAVPFILRAAVLMVMFVVAFLVMRDLGFTPTRRGGPLAEVRRITTASVRYGWRVPAIRDLMLAGAFTGGVSIYAFYALQPYLLDLWGDPKAYGVAGVAAAVLAGAQILGGLLAPRLRRFFARRTSALLAGDAVAAVTIVAIGVTAQFYVVLALTVVWSMVYAAALPVRQAYLNASIPSQQRATILSFDSLVASGGGVVAQPVLGRAADVWGYPVTFVISGVTAAFALPFVAHARRHNAPGDRDTSSESESTSVSESAPRSEPA